MADKKITALTDLGTTLENADLFHVVDDPAGTPINKKVSAKNVFNNISTWIGLKQDVQAVTTNGAIDVISAITTIDATSGNIAVTLSAGSDGQIKTIINVSTSGSNTITITPSSLNGGSTVNIDAAGRTVMLIYKAGAWHVIGGNAFVIA